MKFRTMKNEQYQMYCENARKTAIEYDYKNLVNCLIEKIENKLEMRRIKMKIPLLVLIPMERELDKDLRML